jgi:hypothetical protein
VHIFYSELRSTESILRPIQIKMCVLINGLVSIVLCFIFIGTIYFTFYIMRRVFTFLQGSTTFKILIAHVPNSYLHSNWLWGFDLSPELLKFRHKGRPAKERM